MHTSEDEIKKVSLQSSRQVISNMRRLGGIIWQDRRSVVVAITTIAVLVSFFTFIQAGVRGWLINELIALSGSRLITQQIILAMLLTIIASIVPSVLYTAWGYYGKIFYYFLEEKFELLIIRKRADLDMAVLEDPKNNDLLQKISEGGVWRIQNFVDRQFYLLQNIIEVIIAAGVLIFAEWWIFLIIFISTLPELIVELKYSDTVWTIHTSRAEVRRKFWEYRYHLQRLSALTELKLFQNVNHFIRMISDLFRGFHKEEFANEKRKVVLSFGSLVISQIAQAFVIIWFVWQVIQGNLLIGTLTFFLASIQNLRQALSGLLQNLGRQYQDSLFVTDLFKFLDLQPRLDKAKKSHRLTINKAPEIRFDQVTFRYPDTDTDVLKKISLTINPGEKLAIIGINGAGKSTMIKLLCRFYDPTEGRILIDGVDLKKIDLESWYTNLGVIFQEYSNYSLTVKDLIALGRSSKPLKISSVKEAAVSSESNTFIEQWKDKYDQFLGKQFTGGIEPSVGQWQKLALSRMFYRDPFVIILDEPTSSIDAEAEAKIFERLEAMPDDRTVILISHRFSTVRQASRIVVLEGGGIAELGTHEELLVKNGLYARLFTLQAKGYR